MMRRIARLGIVAVITALLIQETSALRGADEPEGAPVPATPPFASPDIKPTFADWLTASPVALAKKIALTDPLQKPPFAGQPPDSLKGMAAGIRAVQLDIPNRMKAAAYLGTVDCVTYPQAQAMLIATMEEDPSEDVRYEAVMALRMMLSRGCCNMDTQCECESCHGRKNAAKETLRHSKKTQKAIIKEAKCHAKWAAFKANKTTQETRYDCCRGCCNEKVLKALAEVAYGKDAECCWNEPSARVREAAAEGMSLCRTYAAPFATSTDPTVAPVPGTEEKIDSEVMPPAEKEVSPELKSTAVPVSPVSKRTETTTLRVAANTPPVAAKALPVIAALNGYCVVGLKQRRFDVASQEFASAYEGHTFYFASTEAKAEFDSDPTLFAPAYGGIDPVVWLDRHEMVEGKFLREFEGRFYLFSEKEMWNSFKATPQRFVLRTKHTSQELASH